MPQPTPLREHILCVDDEEGILAALRQQLSARFGGECDIAVAKNAREALELIDELQQDGEQIAVVIADQIMPGMKGVELLEEVHRRSPQTVKILLTGQAGLDAVVYAINRAGLDQYIPKPWDEPDLRLDDREPAVAVPPRARARRAAARAADEERRARDAEFVARGEGRRAHARAGEANARLAELAITDGLTGLYNHRHFRERLSLEMERSNRTGLPLSVLMIDVDHFKGYNDRHGHLAGDNALRGVSKILQHGRRANDVVARYGGEEFAIILLDVGKAAAKEVAERICAQVAEFPFEFGSTQPAGKLTISLGVASFPDDGAEPALVLAAADRALFAAKNAGRNRVRVAGSSRDVTAPAMTRRAVLWAAAPGAACSPRLAARRGHDVVAVGDRSPTAAAGAGRGGARARVRSPASGCPARSRYRPTSPPPSPAATWCVVAVPSAFVAATLSRPRAPSARARRAGRRVRVEGARAGDRRHDGRRDRGQRAWRARRRAVRAQLRAGDRARAPAALVAASDRRGRRAAHRAGRARRRYGCASTPATTSPASVSAARSRTSSPSPSGVATGSASATTRAPR